LEFILLGILALLGLNVIGSHDGKLILKYQKKTREIDIRRSYGSLFIYIPITFFILLILTQAGDCR